MLDGVGVLLVLVNLLGESDFDLASVLVSTNELDAIDVTW